jgi:hypothetical protein
MSEMTEKGRLVAKKVRSLLDSPQEGASKLETIEIILTVSTADTNSGLVVLANAALFYYW